VFAVWGDQLINETHVLITCRDQYHQSHCFWRPTKRNYGLKLPHRKLLISCFKNNFSHRIYLLILPTSRSSMVNARLIPWFNQASEHLFVGLFGWNCIDSWKSAMALVIRASVYWPLLRQTYNLVIVAKYLIWCELRKTEVDELDHKSTVRTIVSVATVSSVSTRIYCCWYQQHPPRPTVLLL